MKIANMIPVQISRKNRTIYDDNGILIPWVWANETFGPPRSITAPRYNERWYFDAQLTFYFSNEQDAIVFALKWA